MVSSLNFMIGFKELKGDFAKREVLKKLDFSGITFFVFCLTRNKYFMQIPNILQKHFFKTYGFRHSHVLMTKIDTTHSGIKI